MTESNRMGTDERFAYLVEKLVPALENMVLDYATFHKAVAVQKAVAVGRYCSGVDAEELCKYLANQLVPALERLFADHRRLHKAVVQLEGIAFDDAVTKDTFPDGPVLVCEDLDDPPDEDSPPNGPPAFPPQE